jgi:hypothetical protein
VVALPRDLVVEMFAGSWQPVTVMQNAAVPITRGYANESRKLSPTDASVMLDNTTRAYDPRDPAGPNFGLIGRNTPFRSVLRLLVDDFNRTVSNGWGSTADGFAWTRRLGSVASEFAVTPAGATHKHSATGTAHETYLATKPHKHIDVSTVFDFPGVAAITGTGGLSVSVLLRGQAAADYLELDVGIAPSGAFSVGITGRDGSTLAAGPTTVVYASGHSYTIRAQAEGPVLRLKVWDSTAGGEPFGWQATAVMSTTAPAIMVAGYTGVRTFRAVNNTNANATVRFTRYELRSPRAYGEAAKWSQAWNVPHRLFTSTVNFSGITRRLTQGKPPALSALRRMMATQGADLAAYWPLEGGQLTDALRPEVGTYNFELTSALALSKYVGTGELAPWLSKGVSMFGVDEWRGAVQFPSTWTATDGWAVDHVQSGGRGSIHTMNVYTGGPPGSTGTMTWTLRFTPGTSTIALERNGVNVGSVVSLAPYQDAPVHVRLVLQDAGGGFVGYRIEITGVGTATALGVGTVASSLLAPCTVHFVDPTAHTEPFAISSVGAWTSGAYFLGRGDDAPWAAMGYYGEAAGRRLQRLHDLTTIEFSWMGDLDDTTLMGPQLVTSWFDAIDACVQADLGTLYELRGAAGYCYRTRWHLYNQAAVVTLDYSGKQVAPPLEKIDDDQNTRNAITVSSPHGGSFTAVQAAGPLSVAEPPTGAGRYETTHTASVAAETQLAGVAYWLLALGTTDEPRYVVRLLMGSEGITAVLADAVLDLDVDELLAVSNLTLARIYGTLRLLARGHSETLATSYRHEFTWNTAPATPYDVAVLDDDNHGVLDAASSTLSVGLAAGATSMSVASPGALWTTDPAEFPKPLLVLGEEMTATSITGASSPQTFTVVRSVNGLVRTTTIPVGTPVHVHPRVAARLAM